MKKLAFIFWSLVDNNICFGYPQALYLIPAFNELGIDLQTFEFKKYKSHKKILSEIEDNDVLMEWDHVNWISDHMEMFNSNKRIITIPHNELCDDKQKETIAKNSDIVILSLDITTDFWNRIFPTEKAKFVRLYPPTRTGITYPKEEAKEKLGINTKYAIMCWGFYQNKRYDEALAWIQEWKDTSILFCGTGSPTRYLMLGSNFVISDKIKVSEQNIKTEDSDIWFSAADLMIYTLPTLTTATIAYGLGQGKCIVTQEVQGFQELENISGIVRTTNMKDTVRELLENEDKRKIYEKKSDEYRKNHSFKEYAKSIMEIIGD